MHVIALLLLILLFFFDDSALSVYWDKTTMDLMKKSAMYLAFSTTRVMYHS